MIYESVEGLEPAGVCVSYSANHAYQHTYVGTAQQEDCPIGYGVEATALFIHYLLTTWNFRKIYFEVAEFNLPQFESMVDRFAVIEAELPEHRWYDGRWWAQFTLASYRDRHHEPIREFIASLAGSGASG